MTQTAKALQEQDWLNHIGPGWAAAVGDELDKPYMRALRAFLLKRQAEKAVIYPPEADVFAALRLTPFDKARVVILGQDPYHGPGQAHGLAFSVRKGVRPPPSLVNIYKEISREFGTPPPATGDLTGWARQGVLLLNATLTVEEGKAGAHQGKGWEEFTDAIIHALNKRGDHIVFMLWGSYAQKKGAFIDRARHLVLEAPHPSPLSAHRGFLGCGHFRKANDYLAGHGFPPVDWTVTWTKTG